MLTINSLFRKVFFFASQVGLFSLTAAAAAVIFLGSLVRGGPVARAEPSAASPSLWWMAWHYGCAGGWYDGEIVIECVRGCCAAGFTMQSRCRSTIHSRINVPRARGAFRDLRSFPSLVYRRGRRREPPSPSPTEKRSQHIKWPQTRRLRAWIFIYIAAATAAPLKSQFLGYLSLCISLMYKNFSNVLSVLYIEANLYKCLWGIFYIL